MPTAYAAVEYMPATAKQAAEEVDDPVFAIANLADHSPDQHEECNDERVPQAEREHQHGEDKASDGTERGVGMTHSIAQMAVPVPLMRPIASSKSTAAASCNSVASALESTGSLAGVALWSIVKRGVRAVLS